MTSGFNYPTSIRPVAETHVEKIRKEERRGVIGLQKRGTKK